MMLKVGRARRLSELAGGRRIEGVLREPAAYASPESGVPGNFTAPGARAKRADPARHGRSEQEPARRRVRARRWSPLATASRGDALRHQPVSSSIIRSTAPRGSRGHWRGAGASRRDRWTPAASAAASPARGAPLARDRPASGTPGGLVRRSAARTPSPRGRPAGAIGFRDGHTKTSLIRKCSVTWASSRRRRRLELLISARSALVQVVAGLGANDVEPGAGRRPVAPAHFAIRRKPSWPLRR